MSKSVPGNPQVDKEFSDFLEMLDRWDKKQLDNVNAPLLKKALEKMGSLKGRIDGAVMTNLEQQIGALKGEYRKAKALFGKTPKAPKAPVEVPAESQADVDTVIDHDHETGRIVTYDRNGISSVSR